MTRILMFYDTTRTKYLSTTRNTYKFGMNHSKLNMTMYLLATGRTRTNITGYKIPRNATITSLTIQTQNLVTNASFQILKNNTTIPIISSIQLLNQSSKSTDNLNVNINKDDWLQCRLIPLSQVDYPILTLELAWRL